MIWECLWAARGGGGAADKLLKDDLSSARGEQQVQQLAADVERQPDGTGTLLQVHEPQMEGVGGFEGGGG